MDFQTPEIQENFTNQQLMQTQPYLYYLSLPVSAALLSVWVSWRMTILLFVVTTILWDKYYEESRDHSCVLPLPPGNMGLPFFGETLKWIIQGVDFYRRRRSSYGPIYKTHVLGRPTIRVMGAMNVRKILMGEHTLVSSSWPTSVRTILGDSALALSHGALHRRRRRAVMRSFNHDSLSSYVIPIQDIIKDTIKQWCKRGNLHGYPECRNLTFNIAATVLLGFRFRPQEVLELMSSFEMLNANIFSLPINLPGSGLNKGLKARERIMALLERCIEQKKRENKSHQGECSSTGLTPDIFTYLTTSYGEDDLSDQEVKEAALELLFAGHGTTASAACSLLLQLGKNPEVTEKLAAELFQHGLMNDSTPLTFEGLRKLTYTNMVVREVLRLIPPVLGGFRTALKTFEINGFQVPKGWTVAYSIRDTHETSSVFSDSGQFKPDRWASMDNDATRFHYLPFGGGSRACVGKEFAILFLRIWIVELVRGCTWRLLNKDPTYKVLPFPSPKDNLPVHFTSGALYRSRAFTV